MAKQFNNAIKSKEIICQKKLQYAFLIYLVYILTNKRTNLLHPVLIYAIS